MTLQEMLTIIDHDDHTEFRIKYSNSDLLQGVIYSASSLMMYHLLNKEVVKIFALNNNTYLITLNDII